MYKSVLLLLLAPCISGARLRTAVVKTNATKVSTELQELQHNYNSVYLALKDECKAPGGGGVSDALNAIKNLKGASSAPAPTAQKGSQCSTLCKGDDNCIAICGDVRNMICDASLAPGVMAVSSDSGASAAAAATAAANAVQAAVKDAVGQAAKAAQEAAKVAQAAVKQAAEEGSKIAKQSAMESAKNAAEAAAKAASHEASIGAHAVASTAAAAAMAASMPAKAPAGGAAAPAPGGPGPAPAPAGF